MEREDGHVPHGPCSELSSRPLEIMKEAQQLINRLSLSFLVFCLPFYHFILSSPPEVAKVINVRETHEFPVFTMYHLCHQPLGYTNCLSGSLSLCNKASIVYTLLVFSPRMHSFKNVWS